MRIALLCLVLALISACSAADDEGDVVSTTAGQTAQQCACQSGQFCVDGVCCDTPCSGDCVACTAALKGSGVDGVCGPIAAGTDPESECNAQGVASCGNDGNCNGSGACGDYAAGTVCRDAAGECDLAELCPGLGAACPANARRAAGTGCTSDGNPCTLDECNGTSPTCTHPAGNAGDVCRAAAGECDAPEICSGSLTTCPLDDLKTASTACNDDGNPCTTDRCDGASVVCQHDPGNAGAVCRDSVGACDAPETCNGSSATCAADAKRPTSFVCRPAADDCDAAENCAGGDNCPLDGFLASSVECRGPSCSGTVATLPANCPGSSAACPPIQTQACGSAGCSGNQCGGCTTNAQCPSGRYCSGGVCADKKPNGQQCSEVDECASNFCADGVCCSAACNAGTCDSCVNTGSVGTCSPVPAATICRPAAGECDDAETCGGATVCPADAKLPNGSSCGDDGNPCTTDTCNGSAVSCQHAAGNAGTLCRAANGSVCDVADHCDGTSTACGDDKRPSSFACRATAGECDVEEHCDGTTDACPSDGRKPNGTACTDDGNVCTLDRCDGGVACQHPAGNAGTSCRASVGPCDLAESCSGSDPTCPVDAKRPTSFSCRAATGDCDLAETCDGTGDACPPDAKKNAGAACTTDNNPCTTDLCNGSSSSCVYSPGNGGAVCRAAAGPCDVAEACSGSSAACPSDAKRPATFACRGVAGNCDLEETCTGTGDTCPTDAFRPSTFQCRAASCASGVATLAGNCTGGTASCPNPMTQSCPGSLCNGSVCAGGCSIDSNCSGSEFCSGGVCRPKIATSQPCGASNQCISGNCADGVCCNAPCNAGVCDSCALSGSVGTCSAVPATTVCRPALGECDLEERCGGAMACPADANKNGQSCTTDGNVCTTDVCAGAACTHPAAPAATACRAAAGECDLAETCGGATACPADAFRANGTACTSDLNPCTGDACQNGTCAHPAANPGVICRAAVGECDEAELCSGTSQSCPANALKPSGTVCGGDGNVCTRDECLVGFCTHFAGNPATVCRAAVGECDAQETCTGVTTACPSDDFRANGAACTSDTNPCTRDVCASGVCAHPAGNAGAVCRAASTDCDAAELCSGSATTCPANAAKAEGASCSDDGVPCTRDQCASGDCIHPSNDGATCSDGNQCTAPDTCSAGQCRGAPVMSCVCVTNAQCNDNNACNGVETCVAGGCRPGTPLDCDDQKDCTTDGCSPSGGCTHVNLPNGAPCSDGQYCTTDDACSAGACVPGPARDCSGLAMGPCRRAVCDDAADACVAQNLPDTQTCDDEDVCTGNDRCSAGMCVGQRRLNCRACTTGADCEDSNGCTTDLCNDITRSCEYLVVSGCVPDPPDGGDAGDAGDARDGGSDASQDGATMPPPDARPDGAPGGRAGNGGAGNSGAGGDSGSAGTESADATYTKDDYGACACRSTGSGARGGALAGSMLFLTVFLARHRGGRRKRRR